jgi:amino acid adenylation domain-containing protein
MEDTALTTTARLERMFDQQAARTPAATAILFRGRATTYAELYEQANALQRQLAGHGVGPGVLVGVCLQRTPDLIAVLLAILKAGGAFLPLDPRSPVERLGFMLSDSSASLLITDGGSPAELKFEGGVLRLEAGAIAQKPGHSACKAHAPHELAYVIYTSGSTGQPNGVMLGHGAAHLVDWARQFYSAEERSRVAATTSLCFDPAIFEIFVPLCTGGALVLKQDALEPFTPDEAPTMLDTVPSVLAELCRTQAIPPTVRALNVGGEPLSRALVQTVYRERPNLAVYNHYGPTEATTCVTVGRASPSLAEEPSIGVPVRRAEIMVLDPSGLPVSPGDVGEIHIGGPGLALGYINRPELTARRFIRGQGGRRLYRTGDLGRWRGGELHFTGRLDRQVKIRGFRVELGEVENALKRMPDLETAVAVMQHLAGRSQLVAFVQSQQSHTAAEVRERLAAWLPDYMLPTRVKVVRSLPLLVSGKIDHSALPPFDEDAGPPGLEPVGLLERPIIHVFEEVLARTSVGPEDSFFDLGGDSLSSVHAAMRLTEVLGHDVPAALIYHAPTPRELARSLKHALVRTDGHISLLSGGGGGGTPLFCVADLFGHAFNYLSLARRLGADRPIYGIVAGPLQAAFIRDGDIAALTKSFARELRRVQPHGPYVVAGYSAGGMLAVEVACELERQGEVASLILLDAYLQSQSPTLKAFVRSSIQRGRDYLGQRYLTTASQRVAAPAATGERALTSRKMASWAPRSQVSFAASLARAALRYRPQPFSGPALVVKAKDRSLMEALLDQDGLLGWAATLNGEVDVVSVDGGHHQFLREPRVPEAALAIERFLALHG